MAARLDSGRLIKDNEGGLERRLVYIPYQPHNAREEAFACWFEVAYLGKDSVGWSPPELRQFLQDSLPHRHVIDVYTMGGLAENYAESNDLLFCAGFVCFAYRQACRYLNRTCRFGERL